MSELYLYLQGLVYFNFYFLSLLLAFSSIFYYYSQIGNHKYSTRYNFNYKTIKYLIISSLFISFVLHVFNIFLFSLYSYNELPYSLNYIPLFNIMGKSAFGFDIFFFTIDFFGLILILLAYIVGFISILSLDTRIGYKNIKYLFSFNVFVVIVYLYCTTTNIFLFFLYYELLLLPSFLFVYYISPSRKAIQASVYFVMWTQVGSILVLLAVIFIISITGSFDINTLRSFKFSTYETYLIVFLLFLGFGIKVPIWPFHYWLTKTHVEAPSGFSIYLSGFLVKTAVYGFYKLAVCFCTPINNSLFVTICILGIVDASLKMWGQTDLKKLVAYGTIQEMNIIYLALCWGDSSLVGASIYFCIVHSFLSALMFYIVDCIYRRYKTRSIVEINGILHFQPNLAISILIMMIVFAALPGTIKFTVEFYIFSSLFETSPFITFLILILANVVGLIGFSKCWFNCLFGTNKKNIKQLSLDISFKEAFLIYLPIFFIVFFSWIYIYMY